MIPDDLQSYIESMASDNGFTDGPPGYFQLWSPSEYEELNQGYQVAQNVPGLTGFGSNGGGELLAFDATGAIFLVPFVGMCRNDAVKIADSWSEVVNRITS